MHRKVDVIDGADEVAHKTGLAGKLSGERRLVGAGLVEPAYGDGLMRKNGRQFVQVVSVDGIEIEILKTKGNIELAAADGGGALAEDGAEGFLGGGGEGFQGRI